jgi:hypothetical protein
MKALGAVAGNKAQAHQVVAGRIHYQAFTRWLIAGLPLRESNRVQITSRGGRAKLIDMSL